VAPKVTIHGKTASIALEENADMRGRLVRLNCKDEAPASSSGQAATEESKPFRVKLHDVDFNPYASKKYRMVAGGQKYEGTTGADGSVEQQVPQTATAAQVTVWVDEWPTGQRLSWTINIAESLPAIGSLAGAMERLRNLGYQPGVDEKEVDEPTRKAIVVFQRDHGVPATGALDAPTAAKLEERHGH